VQNRAAAQGILTPVILDDRHGSKWASDSVLPSSFLDDGVRVLRAPSVLWNTSTVMADSGEAPWIVGEALEGE
jgi:6-phosphogluconate dehydrogenase (decarboxylating)